MEPRLRAEWIVPSKQELILASCCLSPRRNSVLEESTHPGAEARELRKTFVGRPLDVCTVREPAANLSIEDCIHVRSGS